MCLDSARGHGVGSSHLKFNRNQLGTVSAYVMISVPWSNHRAHLVISENYSAKNFTVGLRTTSKMASDDCSVFNHIFPHYTENCVN